MPSAAPGPLQRLVGRQTLSPSPRADKVRSPRCLAALGQPLLMPREPRSLPWARTSCIAPACPRTSRTLSPTHPWGRHHHRRSVTSLSSGTLVAARTHPPFLRPAAVGTPHYRSPGWRQPHRGIGWGGRAEDALERAESRFRGCAFCGTNAKHEAVLEEVVTLNVPAPMAQPGVYPCATLRRQRRSRAATPLHLTEPLPRRLRRSAW